MPGPLGRGRKKKYKRNDRIEEAIKKIDSYREGPRVLYSDEGERSDEGGHEEANSIRNEYMNLVVGNVHSSEAKEDKTKTKSTSDQLNELAIRLNTHQITQEVYEMQKNRILAAHNETVSDHSSKKAANGHTQTPTESPSPIIRKDKMSKVQQGNMCEPIMIGSAIDRSSSSPTLQEHESDQGDSVGPMGLFQDNGVYQENETKLGSDIDKEGEDGDDTSDNSDISLADVVDMEMSGSLSSNESEESNNEAEIIAMKNKEKNKDILRELFLDEIERKSDCSSAKSSPENPTAKLSRKVSSVNFSEHDCVQEFEQDVFDKVIPLNMDPAEINLDDSVSPIPSPTGMVRRSSFTSPVYTQQSKMSLQKSSKKKGGFFAALKKKKPPLPVTIENVEETKPIVTPDKEIVTPDKKIVTPPSTTKPVTPPSNVSESPGVRFSKEDENESKTNQDLPLTEKKVPPMEKIEDIEKDLNLNNMLENVASNSSLIPQTRSKEEQEIIAAREKVTKLLLESPEFRATVLSYPDGTQPKLHTTIIRLDDGGLESVPRYKIVEEFPSSTNETKDLPVHSEDTSKHNEHMDRRIAKWNDRLENNDMKQLNAPAGRAVRTPPKPGSHIEDSFVCESSSSVASSVLPETRSETFHRLTQPKVYSSPSVELAKPPPDSGTKLLDLPVNDIKELVEKNRDGKSFVIHLDPSEEKLRIKVKATECLYDWEFSNKFAYYGLNFNRSEFMEFDENVVPRLDSDPNKYIAEEETTRPNGRVRLARGLTAQKTETKKKLLISHEDAFDFLFINRVKLLRKVRPHLVQMDTFCNKYFLSFICLVFDLKMQLLGTYDHKLGKYFPGVVACPPHAQRQKRRRDNYRFSNLLEIDFNMLPVDTFSVVPVVCDISPRSAEFPGVHLQLDVAASSMEDNFKRMFGSPVKSETDVHDSASEMSSLHEQFDMDSSWQSPDLVNNASPPVGTLPEHIDIMEANWAHVESFFAERMSTLPKGLGEGPNVTINQNQTRSSVVDLPSRSSYVPFILYRRYDSSSAANLSGERLWSMKGVQKTFEGNLPHVIARKVLNLMKEVFIVPIHSINVEHCMNCDKHKSTTWHVPGSYEKKFEDLQVAIQTALPPCIITSNKFTSDTLNTPRMGSFDITVRPFFSNITQLLHSKVMSKQFPPPEKIIGDLATLLLPERVTFKGVHTLEMHVYDGYERIPLKGALVRLYRVDVNPSCYNDLTEAVEESRKKHHARGEEKAVSLKPCAQNNWLMPVLRVVEEPSEVDEHPNKGLPQIPRDSIQYKKKRELAKGFTAILTDSKSLTAARMRHSKSFYNVRTWRKQEVARWIQSYGLAQHIVDAANYDGAVDGPSFLSIASLEAFQRWGVKSRIKLGQMKKDLDELKQDHSGNMVTSYDPYTYNELLEGAADRYTESPLHSQPTFPRESKFVQDVTYHLVGSKKTDGRGLCFMNVDVLGSYMLRVESPRSSPYCSNVFQINKSGHSAICASLKPKIGLAKFRVTLDVGINEENFEGVDEAGILVSVVNLANARRHIAVVKFDHPNTEEKAEAMPDISRKHVGDSNMLAIKKQSSSGSFSERYEKLEGGSENKSPSKPKLSRQQSAGVVLMQSVKNRNSGSGSFRGGSFLAKNTNEHVEKMANAKIMCSYCTAEIWLPVGKYYSEVDGGVFAVSAAPELGASEDSWSNRTSEVEDDPNDTSEEPPFYCVEYSETQTRKCHRRLVMSSVRGFQKIYRRYKKNFLRDNIWAYLTLKRSFRRVLKRIREKIRVRRATMIQTQVRKLTQLVKFREQKKKILICETIIRRYIARKQFSRFARANILIKRFVRRWLKRRRQRRYGSALMIQLMYRRAAAREKYIQRLFHLRLSKRAKRYVSHIRKVLAARKEKAIEMEWEAYETSLMDAEHELVLKNIRLKVQYEKDVVRNKLLSMERKLMKKATLLQKNVRGFGYRLKLRRITKAVTVLQKRQRLYQFEQQLKNRPKNLDGKQRFVAFCPTFPFLKKHPELLGATKLLQGMFDKEAHDKWLAKKNSPELDDQSCVASLTSSQFRVERKRSFVNTIMHKILDVPATKIQSVMKMNRDRRRYIERWQSEHDSEEFPPLFKSLPPIESVGDEQDCSSSEREDPSEVEDEDVTREDDKTELPNRNASSTFSMKSLSRNVLGSLKGFKNTTKLNSETPEICQPNILSATEEGEKEGERKQDDRPSKKSESKSKKAKLIQQEKSKGQVKEKNGKKAVRVRAAVVIQKYARRYIVMKMMATQTPEENGEEDLDDDVSGVTKATIAKSSSFALPLRQLSNVSQSFTHNIKRGLSNVSIKSQSSRAVKELKKSVSTGITKIHDTTNLFKEKYEEKAEVKKEFKAEHAVQMQRLARLESHEVNVEDAVLHISGWDEGGLPRLNRKWYVCAFPLLAGEGPEKIARSNKFKETTFYQNVLSRNSESYEEEDEHLEYEMANNRFQGETVRTVDLAPFSRETFNKLNFNVHLAEYTRYSRVHVVVYIQTGEEGGDDARAVRTDALRRDTSVPTMRSIVIDKKATPAYFLPAFHGTVVMNQGKAYSPCGGRMNVNLTPIPSQSIYLSRAQAKRMALLPGIRISATLSPVAVPSANFLHSLLCKTTPPPTYPCEILDAMLFEKNELDLKEFYGAALCMTRFKGRNLVSTRHRGVPHGVLEFTGDGEVVGRAIEHEERMGTVTSMMSGLEHLLCCGSTGHMAVYAQDYKDGDEEEFSIAPPSVAEGEGYEVDSYRVLTCVRHVVDLHKAPVVSCAVVHRAGMDIFFTLDKSDNIGVIVMDKGKCLRTYLNESFVTYHITSFIASLDRLYLGLSSGIIVTINLSHIMNGDVGAARNLQGHILGRDVVFSREAGISTMTIMSQADFFGMRNEDVLEEEGVTETPGLRNLHSKGKAMSQRLLHRAEEDEDSDDSSEERALKKKTKLQGLKRNALEGHNKGVDDIHFTAGEIPTNPKCPKIPNPPLEGHVVLVAGGDKDPRIKVLKPFRTRLEKDKDRVDDPDIGFGFREVFSLPGHSRATTQMVADAAGRYILTTSQGSRQMCIWNALTENCEYTHENVNAASIGLANNALFVCSFKAPFLTVWKPRPPEDPKKRYRKKVEMEDGRYRYEKMAEETPSIDGRPEIGMVRANVWCMNTIQGGLQCPNRSLAEATFFLGGKGRSLVNFWRKYYDRGVKTISKLPPPSHIKEKMKTLNPKGVMVKGLRSKIKSQRQELKRVASLSQNVNNNREAIDSPEERDEGHLENEEESPQSYDPNYNSYYGCYYDEFGNPYNYDEQGIPYYYYENAADTSVKEMSAYGTPEKRDDNQDVTRSSLETFSEQNSVEEGITSSGILDAHVRIGEGEEFATPQSEVFQDESYRTSSMYEDGFNHDSYDENFLENNGLQMNCPSFKSSTNLNTASYEEPPTNTHLPEINRNFRRVDSYGYGMRGDDEEDENRLRPMSSYSYMTESGTFVKRNPLSNRRRHMHMSDSEESDDERLSSIYRSKREENKLQKAMDVALESVDVNGYGYEDQVKLIENKFGFGDDSSGREDDYQNVHEDMSNIRQDSFGMSDSRDESSIISIANERKKMLSKRQQLLSRKVLYELDGDSD